MKTAHNAEITVFANEGEDLEKIKRKIKNLAAIDLTKEKAILEHTTATGALNNRIDILKIRLEKERQVNQFLQELMSKLTKEQKNMLLEQTESRVDEECNFFIRLDKEKLLDGDNVDVDDEGHTEASQSD